MNKIKKAAAIVCALSLLCSIAGTAPKAHAQAIDSMCRKREEAMTGTGPTKTHGAAFKRQLLR